MIAVLTATVIVLAWGTHRLRQTVRVNSALIHDAEDRLEQNREQLDAIEERVRALGIVDSLIHRALAPPRSGELVDMSERRKRDRKGLGLVLLPVGWLFNEALERPAVAAAALVAAALAGGAVAEHEPPEDRAVPEVVDPPREPKRTPPERSAPPTSAVASGAGTGRITPSDGAAPSRETGHEPAPAPTTTVPAEPVEPAPTPPTTVPTVRVEPLESDCEIADVGLLGIVDACL